ncbi:hypothetical protein D3C80_1640110 [compost metagenome]
MTSGSHNWSALNGRPMRRATPWAVAGKSCIMPRASAPERTRGSKLDSWRVMARVNSFGAMPGTGCGRRTGYMRSGMTKPRWLAARPTIMEPNWSP